MILRTPKNPAMAAFLSLFIPGLGQAYAGRTGSAIAFFLIGCAIATFSWILLFIPSVLWSIGAAVHAHGASRSYNDVIEQEAEDERRYGSRTCLKCGTINQPGNDHCSRCGVDLNAPRA